MNIVNLKEIKASREALLDIVDDLTNDVKQGLSDPIQTSIKLDFIIKTCTEAKTQIKEETLKELEKDPVTKDYFGYKLEIAEAGVTYDYKACNDPEWNALNSRIEFLKDSLKERETFLKAIKESVKIIDEETGEVLTIKAPLKRSTTTVKYSLK